METCPLVQDSGLPCTNQPDPRSFYGICSEHWAKIIDDQKRSDTHRHLLAEVSCPICKRLILAGPGVPVACSNPGCWEDAWWEQPSSAPEIPTRRGTSWCYYIRFGDRIKIGTSASLKGRLSTLPYDEILALEPGTVELERRRHQEFTNHLVPGQREWFHDHVELREHIAQLREVHGDPVALMEQPE